MTDGEMMRRAIGVLVLVLGVGALGFWANNNNAVHMQERISAAAASSASGTIHAITTSVEGRDIHVAGIADTPEEKQQILAALDAVDGRRVVTEDIRVLDRISPFTLAVSKPDPDSPLAATGYVPTEAVRSELGLGEAAAGLELASGAPTGWSDLARAGIAALAPLRNGTATLSDETLTITGEALGPDELAAVNAALSGLPSGSVTTDIALLDDGSPANWQLDYDAVAGAKLSGKLPQNIDAAAIAAALGLGAIEDDTTQSYLGQTGSIGALGAFGDWIARIERLRLDAGPDGQTASVAVQTEEDAADLRNALSGTDLSADVAVLAGEGTNGQTRTNAASGATERFMGGYWLALPEIGTDLAACQTASDQVLSSLSINFVTGSDALDSGAVRAINELARFMVQCAETAGLAAEIGGHTDNVGDAQSNLDLSQRRAAVVREQLVARGVPADQLVARGFGMTQPVADNTTEEGRAQNRRTSITWSN